MTFRGGTCGPGIKRIKKVKNMAKQNRARLGANITTDQGGRHPGFHKVLADTRWGRDPKGDMAHISVQEALRRGKSLKPPRMKLHTKIPRIVKKIKYNAN